jgi:sulfur relay (sulfurtransferase) complex TusBCD TusD component (DsrE family)
MTFAGQKKNNVCWWVWGLTLLLFGAWDLTAQSTPSVTLAWSASPDPSVAGYTLYYGTNSGVYPNSLNVGSQTSATLTGLQAGTTYYITVVAYNGAGLESTPSNEVGYQVPVILIPPPVGSGSSSGVANVGSLPLPWQVQAIGSVGLAGNVGVTNGVFTLQSAGNLSGLADNFLFAYQSLSGDGDIRVRLNSKGILGANGGAGIMIRESLTPGAACVFLGVGPAGNLVWAYRGATATALTSAGVNSGTWLRVTRSGNQFNGFTSANGQTWTLIFVGTVNLAANTYIGLAVASGNPNTTTTFAFNNVNVTGLITIPSTPPLTVLPAPSISLSSPSSGTAAVAPASFNLAASVTANGHSVSAVQFYSGATLLGQTTTAPYTLTWNKVAAGSYSVSAKLIYDSTNVLTTAAASVTITNPLFAPVVVLTSPSSGMAAVAPASFNVAASVTANGHSVSAVQFYNGATFLGQATTAPYTLTWTNVAAGSYMVSATLVYDLTNTLTTVPATITVANTQPAPAIALISPAAGASVAAPATFNLAANVAANGHSVSAVQFYNGATFLGQAMAPPYMLTWNNISAGTYNLSAKLIYDSNLTLTTTSVVVSVTNVPPPVTATNAGAANVGSLPLPWQVQAIGSVGLAGNVGVTNGVFTLQSAGNLSGLADNFLFAYQSLSGDGDIRVRLNSKGSLGANGGAGIMIRESLTPGAACVFLGVGPVGNLVWAYRGATATALTSAGVNSGTWLRVTRSGNQFNGFISANGQTWTLIFVGSVNLAANSYIGLAVASGNPNTTTTFAFNNVTITP